MFYLFLQLLEAESTRQKVDLLMSGSLFVLIKIKERKGKGRRGSKADSSLTI